MSKRETIQCIRIARPEDGAQLSAIYAPIVRDTHSSFETEAPTPDDMTARVEHTLQTHPWVVSDVGGELRGYAYATSHRSRAAYQWSCDVSVYVASKSRGQGVGIALYAVLFKILRAQRLTRAYAGIALPNDASIALHERLGFRPVGVYEGVGFKDGAWRDVGWWALKLQDGGRPSGPGQTPPLPIPFRVLRDHLPLEEP